MEYISKLNDFAAASLTAGLGANEGWLYMRLFWEMNSRFWPEYIEFSTPELQKLTGIKSHNTLKKVRNVLKEKGFITFQEVAGKKTQYKLTTLSKNDSQGCQECQKMTVKGVKNRHPNYQKMTDTLSINDTPTPPQPRDTSASETSQDYKTIKTNKTIYNNRDNSSNCNSDLAQVFSLYQECITTAISPIQVDKLKDDVKTYGKNKVMYAILRAAEMGKNNLAYIEGILKNDNQKGENRSNAKRRDENTERDTERDEANRKWREQLREAVEKQQFPWDQPEYNANEC